MIVTLVVKKTRFETADERARELLKNGDKSVSGWAAAHDRHHRSLEQVEVALGGAGVTVARIGNPYASFGTTGSDLVVVVGGDGTFLAASHSVEEAPMLGVNSDPESSRGFFCGSTGDGFRKDLGRLMRGQLPRALIGRMEVRVDGAVKACRVLNEALVCHPHPAATSRFSVGFGEDGPMDRQMSSGAWVGPPAGTTGAIRSAGGDVLPLESGLLEFVSRETIHGASRKVVTPGPVRMKVGTDAAAVYMDGPYRQVELRLGQTAEFRLSEKPLMVMGLEGRR